MKAKEVIFPKELYSKHLSHLQGVKFTRREIDVISCLVNARGTSKIASILSIAPKTIVTHVRNVMLKLGCNSREGVIDFVERSQKLPIMREYYTSLVADMAFERSLIEVAKLKYAKSLTHLIIYWNEETQRGNFLCYLSYHMKIVGIKTEVRDYDQNQKNSYTINADHLLFILLAENEKSKATKELHRFECISFEADKIYYFAVFDILGKIFPQASINKILINFRAIYEGMHHLYKEYSLEESKTSNRIESTFGQNKDSPIPSFHIHDPKSHTYKQDKAELIEQEQSLHFNEKDVLLGKHHQRVRIQYLSSIEAEALYLGADKNNGNVNLVLSSSSMSIEWKLINLGENLCAFKSMCLNPLYKYLDGCTLDGSVYLSPSLNWPYTGTRWKAMKTGRCYIFQCLGHLHTDDYVFLSADDSPKLVSSSTDMTHWNIIFV